MSVSTKPASGFRDFLPREVRQRQRVFNVIEEVYQSYGFERLDTPCVERLDTLMGKYGDEGDQLIFKILQRGAKLTKALDQDEVTDLDLADTGLRYDLTVPLARVFAQHRNEFPRFFKRYQIAPVWRADRPQRGRFREFYQCDVDVVGSTSLTVEAEVTAALAAILKRLEFTGFRIHVNHRLVLSALMKKAQIPEILEADALIAIDKLDKVGRDGVIADLLGRGISQASVDILMPILDDADQPGTEGFSNEAVLKHLEESLGDVEEGQQAISDLRELQRLAANGPAADCLCFDPYLARGLSYYTGPIFEIRSDDFPGSIGGGGRYDGLIGMFTKQDIPACGFSLGVERILVLMEERGMFNEDESDLDVMVTIYDDETAAESLRLAQELRGTGLRVDVYCDPDKYKKQFKYADQRGVPWVTIYGPRERDEGVVAIKNLVTGEQESIARDEAVKWISDRVKS